MQHQIVVENQLVNYYEFKSSGNKTILFLHGWRSEGMIWKNVATSLEIDARMISLDLPGFGQSPVPKSPFSVSDYTEITSLFLKKLELKNVVLVGHSFGGRISIKLAAEYPELIKKLILVDSAGLIVDEKKLSNRRKIAKAVKPFFRPKFMQGIRKAIYNMIGSEDYLATPYLQETYKKVIAEDLKPYLSKIKAETLLLWGKDDRETPVEFADVMEKEIKNSKKVIIEGAGHFSFLDQPDEFAKSLKEFIE